LANGVVLSGVDLNSVVDMKELYSILGVNGVAAITRLRLYLRSLQDAAVAAAVAQQESKQRSQDTAQQESKISTVQHAMSML
jgi:hypothetical protein